MIEYIGNGTGYIVITNEAKTAFLGTLPNTSDNKSRILNLISDSVFKEKNVVVRSQRFYYDSTNNWTTTELLDANITTILSGLTQVTDVFLDDSSVTAVTITDAGGTLSLSVNENVSTYYHFSNEGVNLVMINNYIIQPNGAHTPAQGTKVFMKFNLSLNLVTNSKSLTIFGKTLSFNDLGDIPLVFQTMNFSVEAQYSGSAWDTIIIADLDERQWIDSRFINSAILHTNGGLELDGTSNAIKIKFNSTYFEIATSSLSIKSASIVTGLIAANTIVTGNLSNNNKYFIVTSEQSLETNFLGVFRTIHIPVNAVLIAVKGSVNHINAANNATLTIYNNVTLLSTITISSASSPGAVFGSTPASTFNSVSTYETDYNLLKHQATKSTAGGFLYLTFIFKLS